VGRPFVTKVHSIPEVLNNTLVPFDIPLVQLWPPVKDQRPNFLRLRLIPIIDLTISPLDPPGIFIPPGLVTLIGFGDINRQMTHTFGYSVHEILITTEVPVMLLERFVSYLPLRSNEVRIGTVRIGMNRDAITPIGANLLQDIPKVLHPVAALVARIGGERIPWRHTTHQNLVIFVTWQSTDGGAYFSITTSVSIRGNRFAMFVGAAWSGWRSAPIPISTRPFDGVVGLVTHNPNMSTRRSAHIVGAAFGEIVVFDLIWQGAGSAVAIIQPHHDAQVPI